MIVPITSRFGELARANETLVSLKALWSPESALVYAAARRCFATDAQAQRSAVEPTAFERIIA